MASIKIVATGNSDKQRNARKGKLFEIIIADVLKAQGYSINNHTINVNYSGMEIDIEGSAKITGTPMYAECKCYNTDISAEKIQTFFGKYMTRWFKDDKCHGLFIALPGVNSHAIGFYNDNCKLNPKITIRLLQEPQILDILVDSKIIQNIKYIQQSIDLNVGSPGDSVLAYSEKGPMWIQYLIPLGSSLATKIILFDSNGRQIVDKSSVEYLIELVPELSDFEVIIPPKNKTVTLKKVETTEEIVELRGSSSCFEYQFPASPEFFVGRDEILQSFDDFLSRAIRKQTSLRNVLFEANSGWGKSSLILACVNKLREQGHFAVAVDTRSASSSQFVLKTVQHVYEKFGNFDGILKEKKFTTGYEGAVNSLVEIGNILASKQKLLFLFFDQFENVFHIDDLLNTITQMCLKISDANTNVLFGFAWKSDLIGLTREFPYRQRDIIVDSSKIFYPQKFTEKETNILLDKLSDELHAPLRKDLRFLLSEFSQGYPWLLKKLCAHVKNQRLSGVLQAEIARGLLNVEELFNTDLSGLSLDEESTLKGIAKMAPVNFSELGDDFSPKVIQSLIHRRLIVKVGTKYDIYWDIFRDFLNTGNVPIQEHYMLRAQVGSVFKAISILREYGGYLPIDELQVHAGITSEKSFYNIARDMHILGLAKVINSKVELTLKIDENEHKFYLHLREHLRDRLKRNQVVKTIIDELNNKNALDLADIVDIIKKSFGYISANPKTWFTYSKLLMHWLDVSDMAILDQNTNTLSNYKPGSEIRERKLVLARKRGAVSYLRIQFRPVLLVAQRINRAITKKEPVDWTGLSKSTVYKALAALEDLEVIHRKAQSIVVAPELELFVEDKDFRSSFVKNSILKMKTFNNFLLILDQSKNRSISQIELGEELCRRLNLNWSSSTGEVNVKIMLDWARHFGLAPGRFAIAHRGRHKKMKAKGELYLFSKD